ncbi:hypothetical protein Y032_0006g3065 [Ancylostoma ceylanicum]|uniref:TIL domain-containing protein n=1 Tax=Ancylostoma ceylanicum TaxID=53326 RepID=A0A016VPW5_9BILA|nr:hypothetical protein Y032_0006g3065 [Ancylostoma ceylanicum]
MCPDGFEMRNFHFMCECKPGYMLEDYDGKCVPIEQCKYDPCQENEEFIECDEKCEAKCGFSTVRSKKNCSNNMPELGGSALMLNVFRIIAYFHRPALPGVNVNRDINAIQWENAQATARQVVAVILRFYG